MFWNFGCQPSAILLCPRLPRGAVVSRAARRFHYFYRFAGDFFTGRNDFAHGIAVFGSEIVNVAVRPGAQAFQRQRVRGA